MQTQIGGKYNMSQLQVVGSDVSAAANGAVSTVASGAALSADSPMLWLLGIGAVTIGLVAFSTHFRVGSLRVAASAGSP